MTTTTLYIGSGSSFSWRAWLALEHKQIPHEIKVLSFEKEETRTPEFAKLNPRQKLPVLVDNNFVLYESQAIVDYLDSKYPTAGHGLLFPKDIHKAAIAKRLIYEMDCYLTPIMSAFVTQILLKKDVARDPDFIDMTKDKFLNEINYYAKHIQKPFFMGEKSAVDYALYPIIALALRFEKHYPLNLKEAFPKEINDWMLQMEVLPFYQKTYPPHWKNS